MSETYTIDHALLGNIKIKLMKRFVVIGVIPAAIVITSQFLSKDSVDNKTMAIVLVGIAVLLIFTVNNALNKQINSFKNLKLILSDEGIERKAELQPYKKIKWNNLEIKEKPNGGILLYDKNVSKFNRRMYGKGCIYVQPETMDKDKLLNSIRLKAPYAF